MHCSYCGFEEEINQDNNEVIENALHDHMQNSVTFSPEEVGQKVVDCDNCGSNFMIDAGAVLANCSFCGSKKVHVEAFSHNYMRPSGVMPFKIPKDDAYKSFKKWINKGWFHPSKLRNLAKLGGLHGVYVPFWTYDAHTSTDWAGEAGFHYHERSQVMRNGKMQNTRVRKTRWEYRSGHLNHFFDDILVVGSGGIKQDLMEKILPFKLDQVVNFDPKILLGWEAEIYSVQLDEGYKIADSIMNVKLKQIIIGRMGGDTQRKLRISTNKSDHTFKHILLPVWICAYEFNGKLFQFAINGQTGKVNGKKPISWVKIVLLILAFVLFIVGIWALKTYVFNK